MDLPARWEIILDIVRDCPPPRDLSSPMQVRLAQIEWAEYLHRDLAQEAQCVPALTGGGLGPNPLTPKW